MRNTEGQLIERIRKGDEAAFESVFRSNYANLCGFGNHFLKDQALAEDLVQGMFVNLWERREGFAVQGDIGKYLLAATKNACLNHIKHLKIRAKHQDHVKSQPANFADNPEEELEKAELRSRIDQAIGKLPDRCAEIFKMSRFEGLKYQEIANKLGLSVKTVEAQMGKALKLLRADLRHLLPLILVLLGIDI